MNNGANNFTAERIAELRKNIDLSDIPEVKDFSNGHLRNASPRSQETGSNQFNKKQAKIA